MLAEIRAAVAEERGEPLDLLLRCVHLVECRGRTMEDVRLAEAVAHRTADRMPQDAQVWGPLAYVLEMTGVALLEEAAHLNRAVGEATGEHKPWFQYVAVETRLRQSDRAVRTLSERVAARPDDRGARRAMIGALSNADQHADALAAADRALAAEPDDAIAHNLRGEVLARMGRAVEAEAAWHRVLELDARVIDARYALAFACEGRGDTAGALEQWRAILDFLIREFPDDPARLWAADNVRRLGGEGGGVG